MIKFMLPLLLTATPAQAPSPLEALGFMVASNAVCDHKFEPEILSAVAELAAQAHKMSPDMVFAITTKLAEMQVSSLKGDTGQFCARSFKLWLSIE